jgi:hypothetical protein
MKKHIRKSVLDINAFPLDTFYKSPKKLKKYINNNFTSNSNKNDKKNKIMIKSPISTRNLSARSPNKRVKRDSALSNTYNDPRFGLKRKLNEMEKEDQKKRIISKRNKEIIYLQKERQKLKKILVLTRDPHSLRILSNKILHINTRISKLIKLNDWLIVHPEEIERQIKMNKPKLKRHNSLNLDDIDFSSMKSDMKKINGYLKINKINKDAEIIDLGTDIENISDNKPSFLFERNKKSNLFTPSTEFCGSKRKLGATTMYSKSFKPSGFTKSRNEKEVNYRKYAKTFEDLYYEIEEKNKNKFSEFIQKTNETNINTKNSDFDDLNLNYNSSREKSSSTRPKTAYSLFNKKNDIPNLKYINNNKNKKKFDEFNNKHSLTERKRHSKFNNIVYKVLNDTSVIKDSIKATIKEETKAKKDSESVLLKLANRLNKKIKIEPKKSYYEGQTYEEQLINKLKKIPNPARNEFRKVYKKILNDDRILDKNTFNKVDLYEAQLKKIKEAKRLKDEAYKTMYVLKENILTGREDKEVFKDEMIFDNYGNIDGLEWLIKKHSILDSTNKFIGAYNPKEKFILNIHYPV